MSNPQVILLFSGKRKSGKDHISEKLLTLIGREKSQILRISEPIKSHYAKANNLSLQELMSDNPYKEKYRKEMIIWSDDVREREPGYFCKIVCDNAEEKPFWIVSDIRRQTDIKWFKNSYGNKVKTVRIIADDEVRTRRGWKFTEGIDDVTSECDLDNYADWDLKILNDDQKSVDEEVQKLLKFLNTL